MFPRPEIPLNEDQKRVIRHLRLNGTASRIELSEALSVNNGVMTRLSRELISLGLVEEIDEVAKPTGRGRPSLPLGLRRNGAYAIGLAVNSGWVEMVVVDFSGAPIAQTSFAYDSNGPEAFARDVSRRLEDLMRQVNLWRSRFLGFGVSVPGFAQGSPERRRTVDRLQSWRGHDLGALFARELGGPVWVENDGNAAALAEHYLGGEAAAESMLVLYLSYGVGAGCIVNGRLFRGAHLNAGEIGALYPLDKPRPSALDLFNYLSADSGDLVSLFDLREKSEQFRPAIESWCESAGEQLSGAALSGVCWMDTSAVVIAGALPDWILARICESLNTAIDWESVLGDRPRPKFRSSNLAGASAAIGAAILPAHETISPRT